MPTFIERLRMWFAIVALSLILIVAGAYLYLRHRVDKAVKDLEKNTGIKIERTTENFKFSKAEGGHTLFIIRAARAVQFTQGGRAKLHDVSITVYGKNSSRYDQIYGSDFEYDPAAGIARADGEVQIDLESESGEPVNPAAGPPLEMKNPIHLKTSGLVFNSKTGIAQTDEAIDFRIPQGNGSAVGAVYDSKANRLTFKSKVHVNTVGPHAATLDAASAIFSQNPQQGILEDAHITQQKRELAAARVTVDLRSDNTVSRAVASGGITARAAAKGKGGPLELKAATAVFDLSGRSELKTGTVSGNVTLHAGGAQAVDASAEKLLLEFGPKNALRALRAREKVRINEQPADARAQAVAFHGDALDVLFRSQAKAGIQSAQTVGPAEIVLTGAANPADAKALGATRTVVTAGQFTAGFDRKGALQTLHGAPDATVVATSFAKTAAPVAGTGAGKASSQAGSSDTSKAGAPAAPDIITSKSHELTVYFDAARATGSGAGMGSIREIEQAGDVVISEGTRTSTGERAHYTPASEVLTLERNVRVVDAQNGTSSTADSARLDRRNRQFTASGNVKTTYISTKPAATGALLASAEPIHVTAPQMSADRGSNTAHYSGGARLWQGANIIQAPAIDFDRGRRSLNAAMGNASVGGKQVTCTFVQTDARGKQTAVEITSAHLNYVDSERIARFDGGFTLRTADGQLRGDSAQVYLHARNAPPTAGTAPADAGAGTASQLDHVDAFGHIQFEQPGRRASGSKLIYTANDGKFVLTGTPDAPPIITDETRGSVTGEQLVFFSRDDRVLVEGSRTVTHTQVKQQ